MTRTKPTVLAAASLVAALSLAACSSGGGRETSDGGGGNAGQADTEQITIAMITHQAPGDTFWDVIRKGAESASQKDNVNLEYSNDPDATKQAQLVQAAIDKGVDGIAVTDPNTGALGAVIESAVAAGIPVSMFNAGGPDALGLGAIGFFGQSESDAGVAAGEKIVEEGGKNIVCVIQEQGQSQLEARCDGVTEGAEGAKVERLYVNGRDDSAVTTAIQAKLTEDKSVDYVLTLGAQFALDAVQSVEGAGSEAKIGTFDTNGELVSAIQDGDVAFAIDQQPYVQGYLAVDSLWLYINNGNVLGGGENVATGPAFVDSSNVEQVAEFAQNGTR
ncbi:sugar ABC transporter substrate-binding protein [Phycicoccus sp. CSK15P-2]|uniref:sugar ABC transporter substrate-binding protein n=1 Tax=Phycicoccus sp. CSK15P-2 TaxID=2807627 RepID=UPI00194F30E7|nr:sugar ABC transporter substrate-binding protein [Phycicoccus sp. CSK15P-2]MBM6406023.1 sugar ABC transporter substrate-binding protein [Phycicoccus sp. CSK15P-2]